ncbi:MAG: sugar kinase [Deltaproteobacteria bacterium]|nr:sugar kinase [Deltaproteobacteria bacterium]
MPVLEVKKIEECRYDLVSLGEVMLRLDPGDGRIHTARNFQVWEGGGEYNVARGLRRCFNMRAAVITAFADNAIGRLIEELILQGGVDTSFIKWREYDGCGRDVRNGLNFTERGFGIRGPVGVSDRGNTAASQLKKGDIDWEYIFGKCGVRWFHTGGIFAALSATTPDVIEEAIDIARKYKTIISYDLNYRPSLWKKAGGEKRAQEINRHVLKYVDVLFGNIEDFTARLGYEAPSVDDNPVNINIVRFGEITDSILVDYPGIKIIAATLRNSKSASVNDWGAICRVKDNSYQAATRENLEILDRVGGGDSFASGFIYGMMRYDDPQRAIDYGSAHGALTMTTPGDTSMARLSDVENLVNGANARIER